MIVMIDDSGCSSEPLELVRDLPTVRDYEAVGIDPRLLVAVLRPLVAPLRD